MIDYAKLREIFLSVFPGGEPRLFRAPGRVNLIGEHTDYNGGFVLPMAIDREAAVALRPRSDRVVKVHTANFDETAEFDLDQDFKGKRGFWLNYVEGVCRLLERHGQRLVGADLVIWSDVPSGAGLSSSAALEVAIGLSMTTIAGRDIDRTLIAKIGQQTEHEFVGANVGIMDQFVSAHAAAGHALLLDCRSLDYRDLPFDTSDVAVVICDTNVKHDLATSAYNDRRRECDEAVKLLKRELPHIEQLRDVSIAEFESRENSLPEPHRRRARHVISENERTLRAAEALAGSDLARFGELMYASHASLRDDYEVSCRELDLLVEIASHLDGVLGARMTGGGFGGSTVNLVKREAVATFTAVIGREYRQQTKIEPTILVSAAAAGASEIERDQGQNKTTAK
ncbi:MAG: galactokinase [Pyrinomonadaceae bacterium]